MGMAQMAPNSGKQFRDQTAGSMAQKGHRSTKVWRIYSVKP